jgi:hypothetical protein
MRMASTYHWKEHLNKQLTAFTRTRYYACVKVLTIYWKDGHDGFKEEARELGEMFRDEFQYSVEEFSIPSSRSLLHLSNFITQSLLYVTSIAEAKEASSLLIIHYGGHGDMNDDRDKGEERRSVWTA